jgi:hypothetical protein
MKGTIGLSAVVMLAGGALATMSPKPSAASEVQTKMCQERPNPGDQQTEHKIGTVGICVSGGDSHDDWWLAKCTPENHTSVNC